MGLVDHDNQAHPPIAVGVQGGVVKCHDLRVQPIEHEKDRELAQVFRQAMDVDHVRRVKELVIGTLGGGAKQRKIGELTQTRDQRIIGPTVIGVVPCYIFSLYSLKPSTNCRNDVGLYFLKLSSSTKTKSYVTSACIRLISSHHCRKRSIFGGTSRSS